MTTNLRPAQCLFCARRAFPAVSSAGAAVQSCTAYPGGIPAPIWHNQADHREPYDGDQGQRFEPLPGAAFPDYVPVSVASGGE